MRVVCIFACVLRKTHISSHNPNAGNWRLSPKKRKKRTDKRINWAKCLRQHRTTNPHSAYRSQQRQRQYAAVSIRQQDTYAHRTRRINAVTKKKKEIWKKNCGRSSAQSARQWIRKCGPNAAKKCIVQAKQSSAKNLHKFRPQHVNRRVS